VHTAALTYGNEGEGYATEAGDYQGRTLRRFSAELIHSEVKHDVSWEFNQRH